MEKQAIILRQNSIIDYSGLDAIIKRAKEKVAELNIENIEATEENKSILKGIRADLNKELKEYEDARKEIKRLVDEPYKVFEKEYNVLKEVFTEATGTLKVAIDDIEDKQKEAKKNELKIYFNERLEKGNNSVAGIGLKMDFITFDDVGLNITLSASMDKLKDEINEYIFSTKNNLYLINDNPDRKQLYIKYVQSKNLAVAFDEVRKEKEVEATVQKEKPKVVASTPDNYIITFIVDDTKENITKVRDFMRVNGIKYKIGGNE